MAALVLVGCTAQPAASSAAYVVATLELPSPTDGRACGFDLDGIDSTGADPQDCVGRAPDFVSVWSDDERGVDNIILALREAARLLLTGTESPLTDLIASGEYVLVLRLDDVHSFDDDDSVTVEIGLAQLEACAPASPAACRPELVDGRIAPGQRFRMLTRVASTGRIEGGRLHARDLRASLPVMAMVPSTVPLTTTFELADLQLEGDVSPTSITRAALGGALLVDEAVAISLELDPAASEAEVRSAIAPHADLEPTAADADTCAALSAGAAFEAVQAHVVDPLPALD